MKILKRVLIVLFIIVLAFVLGAYLFVSPKHGFESSIVIKADRATIFNQINDFHNFNNFSPWYKLDTLAEITVEGEAGEVGHKYSWSSNNKDVGKGYLMRLETADNDSIINEMYFADFDSKSLDIWYLEDVPEGVKVRWVYKGDAGNSVMMRYMSLLLPGMMEPFTMQGLEKLKAICETPSPTMEEGTGSSDSSSTSI